MQIKKQVNRILSLLLAVVTLFSLAATPAMAAVVPSQNKSLGDGSSNVTIKMGTRLNILNKSTGGSIGGSGWTYTSNDGITGPAYCVNWGLSSVSLSKKLEITGRYDRNPKTMGAFANGYPQRTLEQFKSFHPDIQGIEKLTENEYAYATQLAIWATCGQLAVPGTAFETGRASLVKPTSDAQQIRVYESVVEILQLASGWSKQVYSGLYFHMDKDRLGASLSVHHEDELRGAAETGQDGIKKETINGKEYYTRLMYVDSATSTYPNDFEIYVYAMDVGLVGRVIQDCVHTLAKGCIYDYDDLFQIGCIGLCKAAQSNQPGHKSAFSTYAYRLIRNEIYTQLEYATRRSREQATAPEELPCAVLDEDLEQREACRELMSLLDQAEATATGTTAKGIKAIRMRIDGCSCREIGEVFGASANNVTAWISKARKHLMTVSA